MAKDKKPENFDVLTAADVADLLMVTEKTVRNWMNKNGLPSVDGGRGRTMKWRDVLEWYVRYRGNEDGNGGNGGVKSDPKSADPVSEPAESYDNALRRRAIAEADLKEIELAEARGQVAAVADVRKTLQTLARAIQSKILAMPSRLTTRLAGAKDRREVEAILKAECQIVCSELAGMKAAE